MDKNNNDLFELMTKMYSDLTGKMTQMYGEMQGMRGDIKNIDKRLTTVENEVTKTNLTIEQDIKPSISALLDGYKQNSEQITRIENKLEEHDEIIIRRVK